MNQSKVVTVLLVTLLSLIKVSLSLECFECTTTTDPVCSQLDDLEWAILKTYLKDCIVPPHARKGSEALCRKTMIGTDSKELHVARSCGWVKADFMPEESCYTVKDDEVGIKHKTICECYGEHCNTAAHPMGPTITGLLIIAAGVIASQM